MYPSFKQQFDSALKIRTGALPTQQVGTPQQQPPSPQTTSVTPTGLSSISSKVNSEQTPQGGSLVDFQRAMRAVAQDAYEYRQGKEKKVQKGQFDPTKVSGSLFADIIGFAEKNRGGSISKMYAAGMEAGTEQMKLDEQKREFDIEQAQKKEEFYAANPELNYGFSTGEGMRTDRHNNPAAFTTDIARQAGLVEGVDYVRGDAFPENPNMFTAKLLGNPIETTIRVIDKIGFQTQSGATRWTYTDSIPGANNASWSKLGFAEKAAIIKDMYRHEGGNGSLFGINPGENRKLTPQQSSALNSISGAFDNEQVVKTFNKIQEANLFVKSLDPNSQNPADDQALIYQFAKAMDPDSAVREGEYATVQKYAQSWAETFGFNVARVAAGIEFLTPQSRENIKATIDKNFQARKKAYDNVYSEYGRRINERLNINDGTKYLTQYSLFGGSSNVGSKELESIKSKYGITY